MKKKLARFASLFAVVALCFSWMCVPVAAEVLEGSGTGYYAYKRAQSVDSIDAESWSSGSEFELTYPVTGGTGFDMRAGTSNYYVRNSFYAVDVPLTDVNSNTVVSISFVYRATSKFDFYMVDESALSASIEYTNHLGGTGSGSADVVKTYPGLSQSLYVFASSGLTVTGDFMADDLNPISNLKIYWPQDQYYVQSNTKNTTNPSAYITSFRVIGTTAGAEDLEELKNIASAIAEQNSILQSMYGDILAVCNSIYTRLGSIQESVQVIQSYFESLLPILRSIDSTTTNIYSSLNTYFDLVLKAIDNQTLTLEEAIQDAELALETYLKPIVDYFNELEETTGESASSLPSHKADLDGWTSDSSGIDADAQTGLAAILPVFTAFSFVFSVLGIFIGLGVFMLIIKKGLS